MAGVSLPVTGVVVLSVVVVVLLLRPRKCYCHWHCLGTHTHYPSQGLSRHCTRRCVAGVGGPRRGCSWRGRASGRRGESYTGHGRTVAASSQVPAANESRQKKRLTLISGASQGRGGRRGAEPGPPPPANGATRHIATLAATIASPACKTTAILKFIPNGKGRKSRTWVFITRSAFEAREGPDLGASSRPSSPCVAPPPRLSVLPPRPLQDNLIWRALDGAGVMRLPAVLSGLVTCTGGRAGRRAAAGGGPLTPH